MDPDTRLLVARLALAGEVAADSTTRVLAMFTTYLDDPRQLQQQAQTSTTATAAPAMAAPASTATDSSSSSSGRSSGAAPLATASFSTAVLWGSAGGTTTAGLVQNPDGSIPVGGGWGG